jgi:ubiquinone biosynthesis protein UbiJ
MSSSVSAALGLAALDRVLRTQPATAVRLTAHAGKTLRLTLPLLSLACSINSQGGLEPAANDVTSDTEINLNAAILLRMALHDPKALQAAPVSGDLSLARDLLAVLNGFDLALVLQPLMGDIAAARADQIVGLWLSGRRHAFATLTENAAEYLVHETRVLASAPAVAAFNHAVDLLNEGVDRLDARLKHLETPATELTP